MINFLPIGTIITLINGTKPLMIFGRLQLQAGSDRVWDYVACLYPEGNISDSYNIFFNQEDIDKILFKGYQTKEEQEFQKLLLVNYEQLNA